MNSNSDRLLDILTRAKHRADIAAAAKRRRHIERQASSEADDAARVLAEKARLRRLLSDPRQDGMRFAWYFTHVQPDVPLDQLRVWIDAKMREADERVKRTRQSP